MFTVFAEKNFYTGCVTAPNFNFVSNDQKLDKSYNNMISDQWYYKYHVWHRALYSFKRIKTKQSKVKRNLVSKKCACPNKQAFGTHLNVAGLFES